MGDVLILCYHAVSPDWPADLSVRPEALRRQLAHLRRRGYVGATFTDAVLQPPARRTVAITFDDAFRSVLELAEPILREAGMPGTVFVPTAHPGERRPLAWEGTGHWLGGPHAAELEPMGWDELRSLRDAGWEIGSHTVSHPRLTRIGDEALHAELRDSRLACETALGEPCRSIAYPYGDVDARVVDASRAAGYRTAAALPARLHGDRRHEWPRVGVWHTDDDRRFALKASRRVRAVRRLVGR